MHFASPILRKSFLLIMYSHSKWSEVVEMTKTTTSQAMEVHWQLFLRYGLPQQVVSDNGPQFISEEFCSIHEIKWNQTYTLCPISSLIKWGCRTVCMNI